MKRTITAVAVAVIFGILTSYVAFFAGMHNGYMQRRQHEIERDIKLKSTFFYLYKPFRRPP